MRYEELNKAIIELVGGRENIKAVAHCMTRLRLTLNDRSIAQTDKIKELDGVIDVVSNDVAYQVIIGTHVSEVYAEFMDLLGLKSTDETTVSNKPKGIKGIFSSILSVISETMTSIIEVLLAAGILAGVLAILTLSGILSEESSTYMILDTLRGAVFYFLPVFIGAAAAKRLNVNQYFGIALAVSLLSASINGVEGLSFLGLPIQTIEYSNTFIPILLGVWFLSLVLKGLERIVPKGLQYFLNPMIALVITLPVTLLLFGPIGMWIGAGLDGFFTFLMNTIGNWIVVALYAAVQPFLVVLGAANFTYPLVLNFLATLGYDPIFSVASTISDIAVCGAMFGYFLRAKEKKQKQTFGSVSFSALMGITEPAVFGVFVKYRRPFLAVIIGGGLGGLIAGLAGVRAMALVWGLTSIPTYLAGGMSNLIFMVISMVVSFGVATAVAYGIGIPSEEKLAGKETQVNIPQKEMQDKHTMPQVQLGKLAEGTVRPLSEVSDQAFASGALGKGVAITPINDRTEIVSPIDGTITVVFPTKHAYGIRTAEGVELLIHIGVDTVNLEGKYFESFVTQGQTVKQGEKIASYEVNKVKEAGFDPVIIAVITNTTDYLDVITASTNSEQLMTVVF
ncbi:PTS glucose transporter subunit IIA [Enterococcus saccharolyticus]|uniref:beta-glucoside-specific PTS transporter subunit IIABC n=1 Tax=Enterococcus saccharolyticus TaxID=41997 RepID=UPI001E2DF98A|nr:beta-glucoside-specific PTS transporter subunit IIABC [Enterococcus saccharolyticus]MCD5003085.1 PTS glucose transporter subunit IIA [Enterococcus saccharolyticus]